MTKTSRVFGFLLCDRDGASIYLYYLPETREGWCSKIGGMTKHTCALFVLHNTESTLEKNIGTTRPPSFFLAVGIVGT